MTSNEPVSFLLVDDVEENLMALEALLGRDDLQFMKARCAREALELLLVHDFALALLDVQLPDMDGFELAELMRGMERTRRVPIIFLTAVATDERRRFRGYDSGAVDYLTKPLDPHILRRKAEVFFELERQRRELIRQRDRLRDSEERFRRSVLQAPTPMMLFDEQGRVIVVNNEWLATTGYSHEDVTTLSDWAERAHGERASAMLAHLDEVIRHPSDRSRAEFDVSMASGDVRIWDMVTSRVGQTIDGGSLFILVSHDVTERKLAERTQQLLIGELNHRVRNTLATVQAIAKQTLRQSEDPSAFVDSFAGRLQALSRVHSMLSDGTWKGADVRELIRDQLLNGAVEETRLLAEGPEVRLPPQVALHLALILHELGTNATKYGALSTARGNVSVSWTLQSGRLELSWEEQDGPPVSQPSRKGFGTTLIERTAKTDGGSTTVEYSAAGVRWRISLPFGQDLVRNKFGRGPLGAAAASPQRERTAKGAPQLHGMHLLIIEDEPLIALEIIDELERAGAIVAGPAGTTTDALTMLENGRFDGVLLDGNLRGEPVDLVADVLSRREIPFIFVTGYGRKSLPDRFAHAGILSKPFSQGELLQAVATLLHPHFYSEQEHALQLSTMPPA